MTAKRVAPPDTQALEAWDKIMLLARENCLIVQAYGGVATLATPGEQRRQSVREKVLQMETAEDCPPVEWQSY